MSKWCKMRLEEIENSGNVSIKVESQPIANDVWAKSVLVFVDFSVKNS